MSANLLNEIMNTQVKVDPDAAIKQHNQQIHKAGTTGSKVKIPSVEHTAAPVAAETPAPAPAVAESSVEVEPVVTEALKPAEPAVTETRVPEVGADPIDPKLASVVEKAAKQEKFQKEQREKLRKAAELADEERKQAEAYRNLQKLAQEDPTQVIAALGLQPTEATADAVMKAEIKKAYETAESVNRRLEEIERREQALEEAKADKELDDALDHVIKSKGFEFIRELELYDEYKERVVAEFLTSGEVPDVVSIAKEIESTNKRKLEKLSKAFKVQGLVTDSELPPIPSEAKTLSNKMSQPVEKTAGRARSIDELKSEAINQLRTMRTQGAKLSLFDE